MVDAPFTLGAVAYDPKVVTIWDGFRTWFNARGFPFDYVLYSHYERQVEELLEGHIDAAWSSPLAWVRARRLAAAAGTFVQALAMRDTDRDLTSVVVVRANSDIETVAQLRGRVVGVGAVDSPQGTLIPLAHLQSLGLAAGEDFEVRGFDVGVGLHGDHIGGERDAARALTEGRVDAACMIDGNHLLFTREGTLPGSSMRILTQTAPYDHCTMATRPLLDAETAGRFRELLLSMSYADPSVRPLLDLEGLKAWLPGRTEGYAQLETAVDTFHFYDRAGHITALDYRP
ncbi:MAG: phosphate/phosphite/phosphonate ABC transporter substrate-binding protein [Chloroflexi bacterium]|nr:phosphate/phosphite/phosphonate ABC transporter substrate-binding protein [Chloroflexota bacterium]